MKRRLFLASLLWSGCLASARAGHIEIIELHNRPADELLPLLLPHLWPGESLTGEGFRLILSAPAPRRAALRRLIESIDVPPVPIRITVRLATRDEMAIETAQGDLAISAGSGGARLRGQVEVLATHGHDQDKRTWVATGIAGEPVRIETGMEVPYPNALLLWSDAEGSGAAARLNYRTLRSGFHALARITGERVVVEIAPRREDLLSETGGNIRHQALRTRVSGRLGEWIDLGGTGTLREDTRKGTTYRTLDTARRAHFWLRVDRLE